ncbi:hydroxymethylglutaryl-CoA lyase [Aestuariibacter salexigens]|uniref:hydroxymethylglutaryl-CoA lyase n=1 Tax=Aestuariibacter salexigens TaxID=226010 RepID=UPI0003F6410B|nr:hydroxymethylglutaryl-CoA lyase [Aestuariibacter salexigens]
MTHPDTIIINDVGPRDGLQNQPKILTVDERTQLIQALIEAGVPAIEVGAFVSPKAVPAMAGAAELFANVNNSDTDFSALIPNAKGFELGVAAGVPTLSLVVATSNTMNEKNIRMTNAQALDVCRTVIAMSQDTAATVQVYVATAFECPFEGIIAAQQTIDMCNTLFDMGANAIVVADTIGAANPKQVSALMSELVSQHSTDKLSCHFHDTRAMGLADVYAAIEAGIRRFDASIAGLGGCPFAPGASGNVATEDVVMLAEQMGFHTGIDMPALLRASDLAIQLTGSARGGNARAWLDRKFQHNNHSTSQGSKP